MRDERLRKFPSLHLFCISSCLLLSNLCLSAFPGWDTIKGNLHVYKDRTILHFFIAESLLTGFSFWVWVLHYGNYLHFIVWHGLIILSLYFTSARKRDHLKVIRDFICFFWSSCYIAEKHLKVDVFDDVGEPLYNGRIIINLKIFRKWT